MKKNLVYLITLIAAIIIQTSLLPVISSISTSGDIVLMIILVWSVLDDFFVSLIWAIVAGILYDLAAYLPIGEHVIIFLLVVYFVSFFSRRLSVEPKEIGWILFFMLVIVATFLSRSLMALATVWDIQMFYGYWSAFGSFKSTMLQIFYNEILFFLLFFLLRKTQEFFKLEK